VGRLSTTPSAETMSSSEILKRLKDDAKAVDSSVRAATISRLETACDEILSGRAYALARKHSFSTTHFRPPHTRVNSAGIEAYVKLRDLAANFDSEWKGPVSGTIQHDKLMKAYLSARTAESSGGIKPARPGTRKDQVDKIVSALPDILDKTLVREELEDGRRALKTLNLALEALRKIAGVDVNDLAALSGRKSPSVKVMANATPEQKQLIRNLVVRLTNEDFLEEADLTYVGGSVRMKLPPGNRIILLEELALLAALADVDLSR